MAKKSECGKGFLPAPARRTATLPVIEARMRHAFPPISSFRKGRKIKDKGK